MHPVAMTQDDEPVPNGPDGQVERMRRNGRARRPASYAPAVPRLHRALPAAPTDRRARPRLAADAWRGGLIDLEH